MRNDFLAFSNLTDEELILLVQNRNEAAFAELISRWTPRIRGVIVANSRQRRDAEEIHTDIWVAVWQNIRELRKVDSFGAWLHRIAFNACKRYYTLARQSRSEVPHQQSVIVEHIDQYAAARYREAQLIADVQEAVHYLPKKVRHDVFAPTGEYIAKGSRKATVYVWNLEQPEHPILLIGHTDYIYTLAFSLDGKRLVSGADDETARVWDIELGKEIARLPIDEPCTPMGFVFSPCGNLIAGSLKNEIRFWCAKEFTTKHTIPQGKVYRRTFPLAFSPCGQYLAGATWWQEGWENLAIRIWDANSGEQIHAFQGHNSLVKSLAFSPNGTMLASGCSNGTILVWDLEPYL